MTKPSDRAAVYARCTRELERLIDDAGDLSLDDMTVQALRTAIEAMATVAAAPEGAQVPCPKCGQADDDFTCMRCAQMVRPVSPPHPTEAAPEPYTSHTGATCIDWDSDPNNQFSIIANNGHVTYAAFHHGQKLHGVASGPEFMAALCRFAQPTDSARDREDAAKDALMDAINSAACDLPEGWQIEIGVECGAGWVSLIEGGSYVDLDFSGGETIEEQVRAAIDAARAGEGGSS